MKKEIDMGLFVPFEDDIITSEDLSDIDFVSEIQLKSGEIKRFLNVLVILLELSQNMPQFEGNLGTSKFSTEF